MASIGDYEQVTRSPACHRLLDNDCRLASSWLLGNSDERRLLRGPVDGYPTPAQESRPILVRVGLGVQRLVSDDHFRCNVRRHRLDRGPYLKISIAVDHY